MFYFSHAVILCQLCGSASFYSLIAKSLDGSGATHILAQCLTLLSKRPHDWQDIVTLTIVVTEFVCEEEALNTLIQLSKVGYFRQYYSCIDGECEFIYNVV